MSQIPIPLRDHHGLFDFALATPSLALANAKLAFAGVLGAAFWGAAMGSHAGGVHIWITTIKMPIFFLLTLALCFSLMHVMTVVGGVKARTEQTLNIALSGLSVTSVCLGALAPVLAVFAASIPVASMASYLNLYVACAMCGAAAGLLGARQVARGLHALRGGSTRGVLAAWLFIFQFTGAQVAWVLRPWIGSHDSAEGLYSLSHGLSGNFYLGVAKVFARWFSAAF